MTFVFIVTFMGNFQKVYEIQADTLISAHSKLDCKLGALLHLVDSTQFIRAILPLVQPLAA